MTQTSTISYTDLASSTRVQTTAAALQSRGFNVHVVDTAAQALAKVQVLIPAGSKIMTGGSQSLRDIGLEAMLIAKTHPWVNLKDAILAETDPVKQGELRAQSVLSPYFLGSVHAIAESGEIVVASGSGSQLPSYTFTSKNVIWVVGTQKIVPTLDAAIKRVREYSLPREDERMKSLGAPESRITKLLIIESEPPFVQRNVNVILVNELVGV